MRQYSRVFKALSDPNRLRILKMLQVRPLCVCEIQAVLKLAPSTVSKHLSVLRDAGFIYDVKENKWVTYHLDAQSSSAIVMDLAPLLQKWMTEEEQVMRDIERVRSVDKNKMCHV